MKNLTKLIIKLFLVAAPFLLYLILFLAFEPSNYFGLRANVKNTNDPIAPVRSYLNSPVNTIILGDSRLAHFDMKEVEKLVEAPIRNLAYGGASLNETLDLLEFIIETNPELQKVYFAISFYTLNKSYYKDRMSIIKQTATNPLAYLFNLNYNLEALNEFRLYLSGTPSGADKEEGIWPAEDFVDQNGQPLAFRKNLMEYAAIIKDICKNYETDFDDIERLKELAMTCKAQGIELILVFPPCDESITQLVIKPLEIDKNIQQYLIALQGIEILDYEYNKLVQYKEEQYYDGFHLDPVRGLPQFTKELFTEKIC